MLNIQGGSERWCSDDICNIKPIKGAEMMGGGGGGWYVKALGVVDSTIVFSNSSYFTSCVCVCVFV